MKSSIFVGVMFFKTFQIKSPLKITRYMVWNKWASRLYVLVVSFTHPKKSPIEKIMSMSVDLLTNIDKRNGLESWFASYYHHMWCSVEIGPIRWSADLLTYTCWSRKIFWMWPRLFNFCLSLTSSSLQLKFLLAMLDYLHIVSFFNT